MPPFPTQQLQWCFLPCKSERSCSCSKRRNVSLPSAGRAKWHAPQPQFHLSAYILVTTSLASLCFLNMPSILHPCNSWKPKAWSVCPFSFPCYTSIIYSNTSLSSAHLSNLPQLQPYLFPPLLLAQDLEQYLAHSGYSKIYLLNEWIYYW